MSEDRLPLLRLREILNRARDLPDLPPRFSPVSGEIIRNLRSDTEEWRALPEINGYGVGKKLEAGRARDDSDIVLRVYVTSTSTLPVEGSSVIPSSLKTGIPDIGEIDIEVVEIGRLKLGGLECPNGDTAPSAEKRPLEPGCLIGIMANSQYQRGTLGCIVKKKMDDTNSNYLLSNSHVIAYFGMSNTNTPVFQPGNDQFNHVGLLKEKYPVTAGSTAEIDAAIALIDDGVGSQNNIPLIGKIEGVISEVEECTEVMKAGASTQVTCGKVFDIDAEVSFPWRTSHTTTTETVFIKQILCESDQLGGIFSEEGDSGSLVVTENRLAIGLIMGGTDIEISSTVSHPVSVCNNIQTVLHLMELELAPD